MDRATPEPVSASPVLGYLLYTDRKSGEVKQRYPIDAERISLGRDVDCDVRLHWDDVSRVHAEVHFDLLEGTATLDVIGTNGLYFIPAGSIKIKLDHSTRQPLNTGDSFVIRKKQFRFEYPTEITVSTMIMSPSVMGSPNRVMSTPRKEATSTPVRRRASHRLSLMPSDKTFVPLSPMKRRQSVIGQAGSTPKKSNLGQQRTVAEEEEEEVMEGIVDIQQNGEGDMIILETREESPEPAQSTPVPPKTPRSVPLPAPAQTPYLSTPVRVPSKVVMSTPPGPMTLHKALLLRSARKIWVQTRPNDVDDAVEDGKIEVTRRKSRSPTKENEAGQKKKSLTPRKSTVQDESDSEEEDEMDEEAVINEGVQGFTGEEQGADASFVEGDSAEESLEADLSLDVPEESIVELNSPIRTGRPSVEGDLRSAQKDDHDEAAEDLNDASEGLGTHEQAEEEDEDPSDLFTGVGSSFTPVSSRKLDQFYTPQVQRNQAQPRRSLAAIGGPAMRLGVPASPNPLGGGAFRPTPSKVPSTPLPTSAEEEEEDEEDIKPEMDTPMKKAVSDRELAEIKKRRQSLATPRQLPSLPTSFKDPIKSSFLVQTPSHPALTRSPNKDDVEEDNKDTPMGDIRFRLNKMRRESTARELENGKSNGRRATVGFVLPETPARPTILASASYTAASISRFMPSTPKSPKAESYDTDETDKTPVSHQTPRRSAIKKIGTPFSLIRRTPIQEALQNDHPTSPPTSEQSPTPSSPKITKNSSHSAKTPDFRGMKTLLRSPAQAKTPYMGDIKTLYPIIPSPVSPVLSGIKGMYPNLPLPPKTPDMRGMKSMFGLEKTQQVGTPGMEGLQEMFASPVIPTPDSRRQFGGEHAGDESTEVEKPVEYRSPKPVITKRQAVSSAKKVIQVPEQKEEEQEEEEEEEEEEPVEYRSPIPAKRKADTSTKSGSSAQETTTKSSKSISSRSVRGVKAIVEEVAVQDDKKSISSRTKRIATAPLIVDVVQAEVVDKPSTSARRRGTAVPAAAAAEIKSKPSRKAAPVQTDVNEVEKPTTAPPAKSSRSRTVSARAAKPISVPTSPDSKTAPSAPSRNSRAKKPLVEAPDQQVVLGEPLDASPIKRQASQADIPSKPSRSTRTGTASTTTTKVAHSTESTSAPSRRTRAKVDEGEKENEDKEEKSTSTSTRSRAVRGVKKEVVEPVSVPVTTRATRSRR